MFRRFLFSRIWSSAQDHAVLVLLLNLVVFSISTWPRWSGGNDLYHSCTSFEGASRGGQPFIFFTWLIGAGGEASWLLRKSYLHCHVCSYDEFQMMMNFRWWWISSYDEFQIMNLVANWRLRSPTLPTLPCYLHCHVCKQFPGLAIAMLLEYLCLFTSYVNSPT